MVVLSPGLLIRAMDDVDCDALVMEAYSLSLVKPWA